MILSKKNGIKLILWILSFELIGFFLGLLTQANILSWYEGLNKSILTPPGWVFSIVWPLLYVCLAILGFHLWQHHSKPRISKLFSTTSHELAMDPILFSIPLVRIQFFMAFSNGCFECISNY